MTDELRASVCDERACIEHGRGTVGCPVPDDPDKIDPNASYQVGPGSSVADVDPADVPEDSNCPVCGSEPTEDSIAKHRLSDMGYVHDDVGLVCSNDDCGNEWTLGIPIGEHDGGTDLWCDSCDASRYLIHRIGNAEDDTVVLHVKCPNCYHFEKITRERGPRGLALVGYPDITGRTDGARPEGYTTSPPE